MLLIEGIRKLESRRPRVVLTIGNFDGLHLGHQALLNRLHELAAQAQAQTAILTFDPHPMKVLRPGAEVRRIVQAQDIATLLENFNVDWLIVEPFTPEFAALSTSQFLDLLTTHFDLAGIVVGHDFAFGKNRAGTFQTLKDWAQKPSRELSTPVIVEQLPPQRSEGEIVSSSRIRERIVYGDVETAAKWLSRPHFLRGRVVAGEGRGRTLGVRTANIETVGEDQILPKNGVYVTRLFARGENLPSVTNIGTKPTFHDQYRVTVEAHVLNRDVDLMAREVKVEFLKRLRDEMKFKSVQELTDQIRRDIEEARQFFVRMKSNV